MIKISVIVPVYNVEDYIEQCLNSIINQSLKEIEIIVVNDGSKDNSMHLVNKFIDSRLKIVNKSNGGLSSARNSGLRIAKGEYVYFIDSDDFFNNDYCLEEMYNLIKNNNSDILIGNAWIYYSNSNKYSMRNIIGLEDGSKVLASEFLKRAINNNFMKPPVWLNLYNLKFLLENNLFFEEGLLHEDELFTPLALLKADTVTIYNNKFYNYRFREGSIINSDNNEKKSRDLIYICNKLLANFNQIDDKELKKTMINNYISLFLSTAYKYRIRKFNVKEKNNLFKNIFNVNKKNFFKILLFNLNKNIYYKINDFSKYSK